MAARLAAALALAALVSACSVQGPITATQNNTVTVGKPVPPWSGTDLNGKPIALSDYRGHPLLINFWASWCGPCRAEQPALNAVAEAYASRGFRIVGVDVRDNLEQAKIFRDELKMTYRSVFDQAARLGYSYQVDAPPSTVLVDAGGVVRYKETGGIGEDVLQRLLADKLQLK